jgi:hypothetical protein
VLPAQHGWSGPPHATHIELAEPGSPSQASAIPVQPVPAPPAVEQQRWPLAPHETQAEESHMQAPPPLLQLPPVLQLWPQLPQLAVELVMSKQLPLQFLTVVVSVQLHAPPVQVPEAPQSVQLEPQCRGSLSVSAQVPPHTVRVFGQVQFPLLHE